MRKERMKSFRLYVNPGLVRLLEDEQRCLRLARTVGYIAIAQQVLLPAPFITPEELHKRTQEEYRNNYELREAA